MAWRKQYVSSVRTIEFKDSVLETCTKRNDTWASSVQAMILAIHDLPAADAIYHKSCSVNFRTMKEMPSSYQADKNTVKRAKMGRPFEKEQTDAFLEVASFLQEIDDEQITINDLVNKATNYMKFKLQEHFGGSIIITEINGKPNVIILGDIKAVLTSHKHFPPVKI